MSLNPVSVNFQAVVTAMETINPASGDVQPPTGGTITHNGFNTVLGPLNASSSAWPCSGNGYANVPVGNATVTIDLTALAVLLGGQSTTVNGNGLKVRAVVFQCPSSNVNAIAISPGASNGYNLDGATGVMNPGPGDGRAIWLANNAPTIGSGTKTVKFVGTNAGDSINVGFVFG